MHGSQNRLAFGWCGPQQHFLHAPSLTRMYSLEDLRFGAARGSALSRQPSVWVHLIYMPLKSSLFSKQSQITLKHYGQRRQECWARALALSCGSRKVRLSMLRMLTMEAPRLWRLLFLARCSPSPSQTAIISSHISCSLNSLLFATSLTSFYPANTETTVASSQLRPRP